MGVILECRRNQVGVHQLALPSSATTAGASRERTMVASIRMPAARPVAMILTVGSGAEEREIKAQNRIRAALVTSRQVRPIPSTTALLVSPVRS